MPILDRFRSRTGAAIAAAALLAVGGGVGAATVYATRPVAVMAAGPVVPIATLAADDDRLVNVRGKVAEVYGSRFVVQDASGRALVEAGPRRDGTALVALNQVVSVQGRFGDGVLHAAFLVGADGRIVALDRHHGGPGRHGEGRHREGRRG